MHDPTPNKCFLHQHRVQVERLPTAVVNTPFLMDSSSSNVLCLPSGTNGLLLSQDTLTRLIELTQAQRERIAEEERKRKDRWEALCVKEDLVKKHLNNLLSGVRTTTTHPQELKGKIAKEVSTVSSGHDTVSQTSLRLNEAPSLREHRKSSQRSDWSSRSSSSCCSSVG
ncbi:unnamed protein product [Phytomonas sp. EM1]|nr:unnamed protein product [Phytomonas sp. EM1]|eukprot:CCW63936.1 unnamed protein product [Phytomonas sp. isolate EM1]